MNLVLPIITTVISIIAIVLMYMINEEDYKNAMISKIIKNNDEIEKLNIKLKDKEKKINRLQGISLKIYLVFSSDFTKKINNLNKINNKIQDGITKNILFLSLIGYTVLRKNKNIRYSKVYLKIYTLCAEVYGKKFANERTMNIIADIISTFLWSLVLIFVLTTIMVSTGNLESGLLILLIGLALCVTVCYARYDEISSKAIKRKEAINKQLPQILSKMALLVTSGLSVKKAWEETAYSQNTQAYLEMQKTHEQINNLMSIEYAFGDFASRCNTKETSKLATSIIQSSSKGNKEVGVVLKNMAKESWNNRKHMAKRDSEKANGKLLIPTMLLLVTILVIILVPIAMNFSSL